MRLILIFTVMLLSSAPFSYADEKYAKEVVSQYLSALRSDSDQDLFVAWSKIDQDTDVQKYVRKYFPKVYQSYEYQKIAYDFGNLKHKYFGGGAGTSVSGAVAGPRVVGGAARVGGEENDATRSPNSERTANQINVRRFPNQARTSNAEILRNNPNSDRISNQDRIRSQLRRNPNSPTR